MVNHVLENMNEVITNEYTENHKAVDIVGDNNVISAGNGVVEMVVKDIQYTNHNTKGTATYGNFVKIKHSNGKKTLYAHLKYGSVLVSTGDIVAKGQKIGEMGDTGNAYGVHLHFEVRHSNERRINPHEFLNGNLTLETSQNDQIINNEKEQIEENISEIEKNDENIEQNQIDEKVDNIVQNIKEENNDEIQNTQTIDEQELTYDNTVLENSNYYGGSIVDGLKSICVDSSYDYRCILALKNGIENYHGTYEQNVFLLSLLKQGKLKA